MRKTDIVVSGIGMITPLGTTASDTAQAWLDGRSADRETVQELSGIGLGTTDVAVLPEFDPVEKLGGRRMIKYMSDAALLGCIAAREAIHDADVENRFRPERIGIYAGTGLALARIKEITPTIEASIDDSGHLSYRLLGERGIPNANPLLSFKLLANIPPCLISIIHGIKGPSLIFTPWEGQTAAALQEAWKAVLNGEVDCALAGGADYPSSPANLAHLNHVGLLPDNDYPAPGAGYLVIERLETARRDGRRVYGGIVRMEMQNSDSPLHDPLAERMGPRLRRWSSKRPISRSGFSVTSWSPSSTAPTSTIRSSSSG